MLAVSLRWLSKHGTRLRWRSKQGTRLRWLSKHGTRLRWLSKHGTRLRSLSKHGTQHQPRYSVLLAVVTFFSGRRTGFGDAGNTGLLVSGSGGPSTTSKVCSCVPRRTTMRIRSPPM